VAFTESYNADGAAPTPIQALCVIMQTLTEASTSGTTMTVKKLDGSTTAFTITLNDASTPTSITRAT
jgi:VCBS repeat-containing protein